MNQKNSAGVIKQCAGQRSSTKDWLVTQNIVPKSWQFLRHGAVSTAWSIQQFCRFGTSVYGTRLWRFFHWKPRIERCCYHSWEHRERCNQERSSHGLGDSSFLKRFHCEPNTFWCSLKCLFFRVSKQSNTLVKIIGYSWRTLRRNYRSVSRMIVRVWS